MSGATPIAPVCAGSAQRNREHSTPELDALGASQANESCKQQSNSGGAGALTAGIGQNRSRAGDPAGLVPEADLPDRRKHATRGGADFDWLRMQRRFGCSGAEAVLGQLGSLVDRYRNVAGAIAGREAAAG